MSKIIKLISLSAVLMLSACASSDSPETTNYSGFLSDYSQLKKVDVDDDSELLRFLSGKIKDVGYEKILIDPVSFYPNPKEGNNVTNETLTSIGAYFNQTVLTAAKSSGKLVDHAGKKTLRVKMAITGVDIQDRELSAYQYVPVAFLITAATGGLSDMSVKFQIEAELTDSMTGEVLGAAIKQGFGENLSDDKQTLTLDNLKPLINNWSSTMKKTITEILR